MKLDSNNTNQFKRKCQETLKQYIRDGDTQNPLVFADFSNEERAMMHEYVPFLYLFLHKLFDAVKKKILFICKT